MSPPPGLRMSRFQGDPFRCRYKGGLPRRHRPSHPTPSRHLQSATTRHSRSLRRVASPRFRTRPRVAGDCVESPRLGTSLRLIGGDVAAHPILRPSIPNDHVSGRDPRGPCDTVIGARWGRLHLPIDHPCGPIEGDQAAIQQADEDPGSENRHTSVHIPTANARAPSDSSTIPGSQSQSSCPVRASRA